MGSLDIEREPVRLDDLVHLASAIALVRPADPPRVVEDRWTGGPEESSGPPDPSLPAPPPAPRVWYPFVWDRYVVEKWLRPPLFGSAPAVIEVTSPDNEAAVRDANDEANGMFGHVHHVVFERFLVDAQDGWAESPQGRRIVFLSPASTDDDSIRFVEECRGVWVGPAALDAVRARIAPPPEAPRPTRLAWVPFGLAVVALLGVVAVVVGRCRPPV